MATRVYLVPIVTGAKINSRSPKYWDTHLVGHDYQMMDYGDEPVALLAADLGSDHAAMAAEADVTAIPADLTQTIGAQLATVQSTLEGFNIPAGWATSGMTYKRALRIVALIFMVAQRFQGFGFGRLFPVGVTLDTQFGSLTANMKTQLLRASKSFNIGISNLDSTSTMRQILKAVADGLDLPSFNLNLSDNSL